MEAVRNITVEEFGAVIFRKSLTQIVKEGALWDTADIIYPKIGGRGVRGNLVYFWDEYKTKIDFSYLARDADVLDWQGTQIPLICFDELTHFSKYQFLYMLSRNRSVCGVSPYIRATCNPDSDSWVREFIDWWIGSDGVAIESRSGVIRFFVMDNGHEKWFDTEEQALKSFPDSMPKSFTFISARLSDNQILTKADPSYKSNLMALPRVERERLLGGNWDVRSEAGDYFQRKNFEIVDVAPPAAKIVRCWDFAGTKPSESNPDPDWTVGMRASISHDGVFYIEDIVRYRINPAEVKSLFINTTSQDGKKCYVRIPQDAGSAGKALACDFTRSVAGYKVSSKPVTGSKEVRATPASSQHGVGNIKVVRAPWNKVFFSELESFPSKGVHDDIVDTLSDCIEELTEEERSKFKVRKKPKVLR